MNIVRHILEVKGWDVWSVRPDNSVFEALELMAKHDIGAVLVMEGDKLIGVLSERDYARKVILKGRASKDTKVREIMSTNIHEIHPDQTIDEAMAVMGARGIRHLPVVEDGRVLGVLSIMDVVRAIIKRQRDTIKFYEDLELDR